MRAFPRSLLQGGFLVTGVLTDAHKEFSSWNLFFLEKADRLQNQNF